MGSPETLPFSDAPSSDESPPTSSGAVVGPCPDVPAPHILLKLGSVDSAVREAQRKLNAFNHNATSMGLGGFPSGPLVEDCMFGTKTQQAVWIFQRHLFPFNPEEWDGIIGPKTWLGLDSVPTGIENCPVQPVTQDDSDAFTHSDDGFTNASFAEDNPHPLAPDFAVPLPLWGCDSGKPGQPKPQPEKPKPEKPKPKPCKQTSVSISVDPVTDPTYCRCGLFVRAVKWKTDGCKGFIVQEIKNDYTAANCTSEQCDTSAKNDVVKPTPHFFEAWSVDEDGKVSPQSDVFLQSLRTATCGQWRIEGKVHFVTQLSKDFQPGNVPEASSLPSTTVPQKNLGSVLLERAFGGEWNCCGNERTHEPGEGGGKTANDEECANELKKLTKLGIDPSVLQAILTPK